MIRAQALLNGAQGGLQFTPLRSGFICIERRYLLIFATVTPGMYCYVQFAHGFQHSYCDQHHTAGLRRLLSVDPERFEGLSEALDLEDFGEPFTLAEQAALVYARKLTLSPGAIIEMDVAALRSNGFSDGEILELNQVAAYFSYANRTVSGLGVNVENETLGLSPGGSEDGDWSHG